MGLTKKKIIVRGKRGNYQRTVMVRAAAPNHMDTLSAGRFLHKHGRYYGKMQFGIGASAAAGGLAGWGLSGLAKRDNRSSYAIGGYVGGAAISGAYAAKHSVQSHAGRRMFNDYKRLTTTQRRLVRGYGILASAAGHIGVVGTAAAAYRVHDAIARRKA